MVISDVLFSMTWYIICHRHKGQIHLKNSQLFSNFTQHVWVRFNVDWNYSDFIQFHHLSTYYFVQLVENDNISNSKLITCMAL